MTDKRLIDELARQLRHHRDLYYNGQPEISDGEFDALEDRLRALAPDHAVLGEVGAAPQEKTAPDKAVEKEAKKLAKAERAEKLAELVQEKSDRFYEGDTSGTKDYAKWWTALRLIEENHAALEQVVPPKGHDWQKAQHELPMGSLNKVNVEEELKDWVTRCDEVGKADKLKSIKGTLHLTEKLDGISIEVLYAEGELENAITRGDGLIGERITSNVRRMKGVPATIKQKGRVSIRGEIIMRKSDADDFAKFKKEIDPRFGMIKSLRNTAAGVARTKDPKLLPGCRFVTILFYDVEGVEGLKTERDKFKLLQKLGFETPNMKYGKLDAILKEYQHYEGGFRQELDYEIDGLVVRADDIHTFTLLGELNNRPRGAVAFKFGSEMQVTKLLEILWSTGDTGRITPIAQIEPVLLAGAEVRQASLHNATNVATMGIGPGDQVLVSRRNDVIPYVEKVVVKGKKTEKPPKTCGVCGKKAVEDGEYILCTNELCAARKVGRLKTWIKHLGLLDWGEKTMMRLYEEELVEEPADLYKLKVDDIADLEGFGKVSAKKLLEPLAEKKKLPMATFIAALGIGSVSKETGKLLVNAGYDTVAKLSKAKEKDLEKIEGLGAIKAEKIITGIKERADEIKRLAKIGVVPVSAEEGGPLAGLSFCFSGAHSKPRKALHALVEKNGGSVGSSVTKGLKYLVLSNPNSTSSKAQKAKKLGTEIIDEAGFMAILKERGGSE